MFERFIASLAIRRYNWQDVPCPACGDVHGEVLLVRDRYLLYVKVTQCRACGLIYTGRNLCGEDLSAFYRNDYRHFYEDIDNVNSDYIFATRDKLKAAYRFMRIREHVGAIDGIVEIGSGLGFFIRECVQNHIDNVIGFEPGELFSSYAINDLGLSGKVINSDYHLYSGALPKANVYVMFHVLEHLEYPGELLDWVAQRISNGWLVIEVPDIAQGWESLGLVNFHFGHRAYFSIESLGKLLHRHGFGVEAFQTEIDDGIYPGNMRVFARHMTVSQASFLSLPHSDRGESGRKVRAVDASRWSNGLLRCAMRLLRP
jgi:hypothetical protein